MPKLSELEARLGYRFKNLELLSLALSHRSYHSTNNERLEFLGDALLDLIISEALYQGFPKAREGQMTRVRSTLVKGETLADIAKGIGLGEFLKLGSGELKSGGHRRASILADALEAIFGAIYLDEGLESCRLCVLKLFESRLSRELLLEEEKDPKTRLQEWLQARKKKRPSYTVVRENGESQIKQFEVECSVSNLCPAQCATGESKRGAEMAAAEKVLALLDKR